MKTIVSGLQVAETFLDDVRMSDWERLGKYVVARRVKLGFMQRGDFASAVQFSYRLLSDIETGRRSNFDAATIARLEEALGWETGSVVAVAAGGEPLLVSQKSAQAPKRDGLPPVSAQIQAIYESNMPTLDKIEAIRLVLDLYRQAEAEAAAAQGTAFNPTVETSNN